jgi:hypothetical protein
LTTRNYSDTFEKGRKGQHKMNSIFCNAIKTKRIIELRYKGYSRSVEPHAHGRDKNGDEILRCYQVSGGSKKGERVGWKLLKVNEIFSSHITEDIFIPRSDYHQNDKAIEYICCQL